MTDNGLFEFSFLTFCNIAWELLPDGAILCELHLHTKPAQAHFLEDTGPEEVATRGRTEATEANEEPQQKKARTSESDEAIIKIVFGALGAETKCFVQISKKATYTEAHKAIVEKVGGHLGSSGALKLMYKCEGDDITILDESDWKIYIANFAGTSLRVAQT